jgi:hypothetical protein
MRTLYRAVAWLWDHTAAPLITWLGPRIWPHIKGIVTRLAKAFWRFWERRIVPILGKLWQWLKRNDERRVE